MIRHAILAFGLVITAAAAFGNDSVSLAAGAVTDIYVRPLGLTDVVLAARTDYFKPGTFADTVFIDLYASRTCCVPVANSSPLLTFAVFVQDGRLRSVSATGVLMEEPQGRSLLNPDEVEREVIAAVKHTTTWRGVESSTVERVNDHDVRRLILKVGAREKRGSRFLIIDIRSRIPRLIELP